MWKPPGRAAISSADGRSGETVVRVAQAGGAFDNTASGPPRAARQALLPRRKFRPPDDDADRLNDPEASGQRAEGTTVRPGGLQTDASSVSLSEKGCGLGGPPPTGASAAYFVIADPNSGAAWW